MGEHRELSEYEAPGLSGDDLWDVAEMAAHFLPHLVTCHVRRLRRSTAIGKMPNDHAETTGD